MDHHEGGALFLYEPYNRPVAPRIEDILRIPGLALTLVAGKAGRLVVVPGEPGAGKTTLFNCITGYYPPSRGEIIFKGERMNGLQPDKVCKLGMARTWQKVRPLAKLSVIDNVMVGALCRTNSLKVARELAMEQLKVVRLDNKAHFLAGGCPSASVRSWKWPGSLRPSRQ